MSVLLMRLAGPMQSWGTQSRFTHRDTGREPSKSGVVGLLCAACGVARDDRAAIRELASLPMGVRVDREGRLERDYHTAGGGTWPDRSRYGVWSASGGVGGTVVSERFYLADAYFLVALEAPRTLAERLQRALAEPVWPLYLGRKSFPPGLPVWLKDGVREGTIRSVLFAHPWAKPLEGAGPGRLRLVLECGPDEGQPRRDFPVCFDGPDREFGLRYVKYEWLPVEGLPTVADGEV